MIHAVKTGGSPNVPVKDLFKGLTGEVFFLDDPAITGENDEKHIQNMMLVYLNDFNSTVKSRAKRGKCVFVQHFVECLRAHYSGGYRIF